MKLALLRPPATARYCAATHGQADIGVPDLRTTIYDGGVVGESHATKATITIKGRQTGFVHLEFEYAEPADYPSYRIRPEVIRRTSRRFPWDLASALAARSPGVHATRAARATRATRTTRATSATNEPTAATSAAAAGSAANKPAAATTEAAAPSAATATSTAAATTAAAPRGFHATANVFPIEEMERGETDVGHFLFAKNEALIGRGIVRLRDTGSGRCGC